MTTDPVLHDRGEKVLWWGRPEPFMYAVKKSWQTFLFGIPFLAFAIFWSYSARMGGVFALAGIVLVTIGLGMVLSPLWHYFRGTRVTYALTERRTVIDIGGFLPRRISVPLSEIGFIDLRDGGSGSGDVYFRETVSGTSRNPIVNRDGFIGVPDVKRVEELLRNAVDASRRPAAP